MLTSQKERIFAHVNTYGFKPKFSGPKLEAGLKLGHENGY